MPKTWSWMHFTSMDNGITFTQIDCTTKKIRCFVQVYEDLTTSVGLFYLFYLKNDYLYYHLKIYA